MLFGGAAIGLAAAYLAIRTALGLFADPAKNRKVAEKTLWLGVPVVCLALIGANLLLTAGQNDVTVWPLIAMAGTLWSAFVIGAALYLRSPRVQAYFAEVAS